MDALEAEHQKLQDHCLCLESEVLGKEEELCMKTQEFQKLESERLRGMEELRAVASFWNEKWHEAALSLSTQRELEAMKQQDPGHEVRLAVCTNSYSDFVVHQSRIRLSASPGPFENVYKKMNETNECTPLIVCSGLESGRIFISVGQSFLPIIALH